MVVAVIYNNTEEVVTLMEEVEIYICMVDDRHA